MRGPPDLSLRGEQDGPQDGAELLHPRVMARAGGVDGREAVGLDFSSRSSGSERRPTEGTSPRRVTGRRRCARTFEIRRAGVPGEVCAEVGEKVSDDMRFRNGSETDPWSPPLALREEELQKRRRGLDLAPSGPRLRPEVTPHGDPDMRGRACERAQRVRRRSAPARGGPPRTPRGRYRASPDVPATVGRAGSRREAKSSMRQHRPSTVPGPEA